MPGYAAELSDDDEVLRREDGELVTCVGRSGARAYACAGSELRELRDDGALGERLFGLDEVEILHTRSTLIEKCLYVFVCLLSIVIALAGTSDSAPGYIYFLLGPLQAANGWYHGRKVRALVVARAA